MTHWVGIGGIGLAVGREWENFMVIFIHGSFGGSQWDLFSGGKKLQKIMWLYFYMITYHMSAFNFLLQNCQKMSKDQNVRQVLTPV